MASISSCPLQLLQMSPLCCICTCPSIPRASIGSCPLQHLQMSPLCCICTCGPGPRASNFPVPPQHLQMASACHTSTHVCALQLRHWTPIVLGPFQNLQ